MFIFKEIDEFIKFLFGRGFTFAFLVFMFPIQLLVSISAVVIKQNIELLDVCCFGMGLGGAIGFIGTLVDYIKSKRAKEPYL